MLPPSWISRLETIDWDIRGDYSESPFSSIHWYPGRFASQIPASVIGLMTKPGDLVVDPFMGSGTTIVEAQRLRRRAIGIDLNPIACIVAKAKTLSAQHAKIHKLTEEIRREAKVVLGKADAGLSISARSRDVPTEVQSGKWYTTPVFHKLCALWTLIGTHRGAKRALAEAAFSAILLPVCKETRHWGYVCDNCTPTTNHESSVYHELTEILDRLTLAYARRDDGTPQTIASGIQPELVQVICGDAVGSVKRLAPESVDLVVTSPPYFGVTDYIKTQRPSMEWFGHQIEPLRLEEIGARSKRHRREAVEQYLCDLQAAFLELHKALRSNHPCVLVIGESASRDEVLPEVRMTMGNCGFTEEFEAVRRVSNQRRQIPSVASEHVLVYSKGKAR